MSDLFGVQNGILLVISIVLFIVKCVAMVDCVTRSKSDIASAGTLEKKAWLIILGLSLAAHAVFWGPLSLLNLAGTVAAFVYLAQVRSVHH